MPVLLRTRLSFMMFVFYAALGAWAVTTATYLLSHPTKGGLAFTTGQVGWIYSTFALGGLIANPLVGLLADRLFSAQRVFAVSTATCGLFVIAAGIWCDCSFPHVDREYRHLAIVDGIDLEPANPGDLPESALLDRRILLERLVERPEFRATVNEVFVPFFLLMVAQSIALQIAITLTTVISLRNLPDPGRQFSRVRMWGTIGWVVVGLLMGFVLDICSPEPFYLSGLLAILIGLYGLTLPRTPPQGRGYTWAESFGLPALRLLRDRSFVIFLLIAFVASVTNQFYGVYAHKLLSDMQVSQPERWMTLGQGVEIAVMFSLPILRPKDRLKWLMILGLVGWVIRGLALISGSKILALGLAVPMHGWSYAFFFILAATYIDREALPHLRASAQAIVSFVSSGLGQWTGNILAAWNVDRYRTADATDWQRVWMLPTVTSVISLFVFLLMFRPPPSRETE